MNLFSFTAHFTDELSCRKHFKSQRDNEGVVCIKCNDEDHYWLKNKWSYQCKKCSYRTSLRKGTVMENSNLPFLIWYKTMFLMSATKKGFSSKEIQKQLGLKRYETVWAMVHKLRRVMGKRDDLYTLEGMLELDEGYFEIESSKSDKLNQKRGKGSNSKKNVAVMVESTPLENLNTGESSSQCRYFKMKVLESHGSEEINKTIQNSFAEKTIFFSDKSTSYIDLSKYVASHISEKSTKETTATTLKWVHIAISNAKRNLVGNHYKIKGKYLQNYLDEFVYKLNRRYFGDKIFDRLIIAGITNTGK